MNACGILTPKKYLNLYKLVLEKTKGEMPIIVQLTHHDFKEALNRTRVIGIEKMISFTNHIPGFQLISKTAAKKIM